MWTMGKIYGGSSYLREHLAQNDYYAEKERVIGEWVGLGAERMGIEGQAIEAGDEAFGRLRENLHPTLGTKLTPRPHTSDCREASYSEAEKELTAKLRKGDDKREPSSFEVENYRREMDKRSNRIAFFDFQVAPHKSVSIMGVMMGDERVRQAHAESVRVALAELESFAAFQGKEVIGRTKKRELTGEICAALFEHDASRSLDPQLHCHCVIANATWSESRQRWLALEPVEMVKAIRYAGKVYQNDLGARLQALGYKLVDEHDQQGNVIGFAVEGVSKEVCEEFSQRRKQIEVEIEKFKEDYRRPPSRGEIAVITKETREAKLNGKNAANVQAQQQARLKPEELAALKRLVVEAHAVPSPPSQEDKERLALQAAISHGFERASVKKAHAILADALNAALGSVDLKKLKDALLSGEGEAQLLANETAHPLVGEYATRSGIRNEEWAVGFVNATNGKFAPIADKTALENSQLSEEQKAAVEFVCRSRNQVVAVRGVAGAGKTTMLKALDRQLKEARCEMLYLAPTSSAAKVLQREGFLNAATVSDYLTHASKRPYANAVIVIDEAGLQSNRQGAEVLALAQKHRQRIVFVGDSRQHVSVEAGDFLRILETHSRLESRELTNIRRQTAEDYRQAVSAMADGKTALGMEQLDQLGWIHEGKAEYLREAAEAWMERSEQGTNAGDVVCVAPTWNENFALSQEIRERLKSAGKLGQAAEIEVVHSLQLTESQKQDLIKRLAVNPDLRVTPTAKMEGLEQGRSYAIESVKAGRVKLKDTHRWISPKKDARHFDVGERRRLEVAKGDLLLIRANNGPVKARTLVNGQVVTVESVRPDGSIQTQCGKEIPATFQQFCHGYVVTSHKAQGRTARHVIVAADRLDGKSAYVACSRGRQSCTVYTPDKNQLFAGLPFAGDRRAALDVLKEQQQAARNSRPPSILNRIRTSGAAVARRVSQLSDRLRSQAARGWAMRQAPQQQPTKRPKMM